jgi:hypothetical protein
MDARSFKKLNSLLQKEIGYVVIYFQILNYVSLNHKNSVLEMNEWHVYNTKYGRMIHICSKKGWMASIQ